MAMGQHFTFFSRKEDDPGDETTEALESEIRHRPQSLAYLCRVTLFNRKELQTLYRGFKENCPRGTIDLARFKELFSCFFPFGGSTDYAQYVFNTFDTNRDNVISFEEFAVGLSVLSRGSSTEKLRWVFDLYDINGDSVLTEDEILQISQSVQEMMGPKAWPPIDRIAYRKHALETFQKLDANGEGKVTWETFKLVCERDPTMYQSLHAFDTVFTRTQSGHQDRRSISAVQ